MPRYGDMVVTAVPEPVFVVVVEAVIPVLAVCVEELPATPPSTAAYKAPPPLVGLALLFDTT